MIHCTDIEFTYDGERLALAGVDLHVAPGEFVCILGGNGSGKSTLAKHLNALLLPDRGAVTVDGYDTAEPRDVYRIRSTAGMVFQNPDDQLVASLVEDDVAFGPENLGVETAELHRRVRDALKQVGLVGFEKHETNALSGGQKQRVAIAGVLGMQPKILILDEASAMLDPRGRKGLMRVCRELNGRGMTVVMITHFMEEAAAADRVVVLDRGKVACNGAPRDVLVRTDVLAGLNLEVPFACNLSLKLREAGVDVPVCVEEAPLVDAVAAALREGLLTEGPAGPAADPESGDGAPNDDALGAAEEPGAEHPRAALQDDGEGRPQRSGRNGKGAGAIVAFENVSFTYNPAKGKRKRAGKGKGSRGPHPDWGNDPDAVWALRDVSFAIAPGEFFGIAGHTGSGKSTL
ncbi:MAG: energy-coupling factor transporter ATPase, partial [Gordonibacter urolithinfaciens]